MFQTRPVNTGLLSRISNSKIQTMEYQKHISSVGMFICIFMFFLVYTSARSIVNNPRIGYVLCLLPFILWFGLIDKKNILYLLILFLPLHSSPYISQNLMGLPGAKPFNLLSIFVTALFFYHGGSLLRTKDPVEKKTLTYLFIYFALFSLVMFRSLDYLPRLHMLAPEQFQSSALSYMLSFYIKPSLYLVSFIYILKHIKTEAEILKCINAICISLFILSLLIIFVSVANLSIVMNSRGIMNEYWEAIFGLHYNAIGSIYIICVPLLMLKALDKSIFSTANYILAALAVSFLQSRSTIAIFLGETILLLYFLKQKKLLVIAIVPSCMFYALWELPEFLQRTLSIGLISGDVDKIFTGRIDSIWLPLIKERFSNLNQLLFGVGRFSMMDSPLYLRGYILQTSTAHNAFVEFFIDCGVILFACLIFCLIRFLKTAWFYAKKIDSALLWTLFTCLIAYLVGTISGRKIYPSNDNMFLFPIIALLINYLRVYKATKIPLNGE